MKIKIKIKFKQVFVEEHEVFLDIDKGNLWRYRAASPEFTEEEKVEICKQMRDGKFIELHHNHYKKLRASGYKGWFDFKVTKPRLLAKSETQNGN